MKVWSSSHFRVDYRRLCDSAHAQSAGNVKPDVSTKKGRKKNKQQLQQQQQAEARAAQPQQHKSARPRQAKQRPPARLTLQDITVTPQDELADGVAATGECHTAAQTW